MAAAAAAVSSDISESSLNSSELSEDSKAFSISLNTSSAEISASIDAAISSGVISTIESNEAAVKAANVALDGVRQEQQFGSRTTLDVLDAERELFNAEVQLVIAKRNKVVAAYSVLAILGKLTAKELSLNVPLYDADEYYDDTEYQLIGF